MEKRNTMLLTVVAIATLLVAVVGATFAYFTATGNTTASSEVTVTTSSHDSTTATGGQVSLTVTATDMQESNGSNSNPPAIGESNTPGHVTLATSVGSGGGTSICTYNIIYTPNSNGAFTYSALNTTPYPELVIRLKAEATNATISSGYETYVDKNIAGVTSASPLTLVSGATLTVAGANKTGSVLWSILPIFYNLAIKQDDNAGKAFGGSVTFDSVQCVNNG